MFSSVNVSGGGHVFSSVCQVSPGLSLCMVAMACAPLVLAATASTSAAASSRPKLRFVQVCDTQLGFGPDGYESDLAAFLQAVRQINRLRPDFVVICGDLVDTPTAAALDDFTMVRSQFTVPCYCAPGNHDLGGPLDPRKLDRYRQTIGKDYYSFEHKGYTFIIVNTQLWKSPVEPESSKHDAWFEAMLGRAREKSSPVFVIGHHPLFLRNADEPEEYFNIPPKLRKELLQLFVRHGVVAMLSGHTHQLYDNEYQGMLFVSGETTSNNFDKRPLGFRVWEVGADNSVHHTFVALEPQRDRGTLKRQTTKILLIATPPDHPYGTHMYRQGCELLAKCLRQNARVEAVVSEGWPQDPHTLEGVRAIALYSGPGDFVLSEPHRQQFEAMMRRGVGFCALHWSTGAGPQNAERYKAYLGGYFTARFGLAMAQTTVQQVQADHPVSRGWTNFETKDEIYLNPDLLPQAHAVAKVNVRGPADAAPQDQIVAWTYERPDSKQGRSFGCTLGHFHGLFGKPPFRRLIVNGILWSSGLDVPEEGATCRIGDGDLALPPDPRIVAEVGAFDADGDGDLSDSELDALIKARIKHHRDSGVYAKVFDKDKDGKLSEDEERQGYAAVKADFLRQCRAGKVPISAAQADRK